MRTNFKKFPRLLIFSLLILYPFLVFADFNLENWLFYKEIFLPEELKEKGPVAVELDNEVFASTKSDFSDLRIIENRENEVPFKLIRREEGTISEVEIINSSSVRSSFENKSFGVEKMLDKNRETYFQNDYKKEPKKTSFILDLKRKVLLNKIMILSSDAQNTWTSIQIEGSSDLEKWEVIKEKISIPFTSQREIAYSESFYQYLKLTFEHTGSLKIHEIEVYSAPSVFLIFIGEPGKDYKLYYGNDLGRMPSYEVKLSLENAFFSSLGKEFLNPQGKADYDKDGVSNNEDNCPFISNSGQEDSDKDGIGDACDNCPTFKNPRQLDSNSNGIGNICEDDDKDGILNVIDNCPAYPNSDQKDENSNGVGDACEDFDNDGVINNKDNCLNEYNPNQADKDKDGIGDACDSIDDRWTEKYPQLLWGTIAVVIGIIIFFAYRLLKKVS